MNKKQYNNVIDYTLKHEQTVDSLSTARAIFNNMGVALPQGDIKTVYNTIKTGKYMGWRACGVKQAQTAANNGIAAIGINENTIIVLSANDDEQPVKQTASVMSLDENTSAFAMDGLRYYMYSSVTTNTPVILPNLADFAQNEIGNNSQKYTAWYNVTPSTSWCAIFASWCAEQCDFITKGVMPKFSSCTTAVAEWFKPKGLFKTRETYVPKRGDLIFFNWNGREWGTSWTEPTIPNAYDKNSYSESNNFQHIGIVEKVENGMVYTIEGNPGSLPNNLTVVGRYNYSLQYSCIRGYCVPWYEKY